jgi:hypothetical protein
MIRNYLVLRRSEKNVRKLKNRYKLTWFVEPKIHKSEVRKPRDRCTKFCAAIFTFDSVSLSLMASILKAFYELWQLLPSLLTNYV